jgi:tRNA nucleotidyltransferase/poly(A) polymerase
MLPDLTANAPIFDALRPLFAHAESGREGEIYLVGGALRDLFLRRPLHDLDFATPRDGRHWARRIADHFDGAYYPLDPERGVGRAIIHHDGHKFVVDVAQFRGETLQDDLRARDFTLNAMALPMSDPEARLIDPLNGLLDLQQKRLRQCAPDAIPSDPARALRAVRQSVAFKLLIEPATRAALRANAPRIAHISAERARDELLTMLGGPRPHVALRALEALGMLKLLVPEAEAMHGVPQSKPHVYDVWEHTLAVVERLEDVLTTISPHRTDETAADSANGLIVYLLDKYRKHLQDHLAQELPNDRALNALLVLAALLHDSGKPATRTVGEAGRIHFYRHEMVGARLAEARAEALRLSNDESARLQGIVLHHMRPMMLHAGAPEVSRRAVYRYWNATGGLVGVDVCILTLADYLGMVGTHLEVPDWLVHLQIVGALLDGYFNRKAEVVAPPPLVSGRELMQALSLAPGPEVGRLLAAITEGQAAGEVMTSQEALQLAQALRKPERKARNGDQPS